MQTYNILNVNTQQQLVKLVRKQRKRLKQLVKCTAANNSVSYSSLISSSKVVLTQHMQVNALVSLLTQINAAIVQQHSCNSNYNLQRNIAQAT